MVGIYLGLLAALISTFFIVNVFFGASGIFMQDSAFFSYDLTNYMQTTIFHTYTRSWVVVVAAVFFSLYVCV